MFFTRRYLISVQAIGATPVGNSRFRNIVHASNEILWDVRALDLRANLLNSLDGVTLIELHFIVKSKKDQLIITSCSFELLGLFPVHNWFLP